MSIPDCVEYIADILWSREISRYAVFAGSCCIVFAVDGSIAVAGDPRDNPVIELLILAELFHEKFHTVVECEVFPLIREVLSHAITEKVTDIGKIVTPFYFHCRYPPFIHIVSHKI